MSSLKQRRTSSVTEKIRKKLPLIMNGLDSVHSVHMKVFVLHTVNESVFEFNNFHLHPFISVSIGNEFFICRKMKRCGYNIWLKFPFTFRASWWLQACACVVTVFPSLPSFALPHLWNGGRAFNCPFRRITLTCTIKWPLIFQSLHDWLAQLFNYLRFSHSPCHRISSFASEY